MQDNKRKPPMVRMRKVLQANLKKRRRSIWTIKVYHMYVGNASIICPFVKRKVKVHLHSVCVHRYCSTDLQKLHCIILVTTTDYAYGAGHFLIGGVEIVKDVLAAEPDADDKPDKHFTYSPNHLQNRISLFKLTFRRSLLKLNLKITNVLSL